MDYKIFRQDCLKIFNALQILFYRKRDNKCGGAERDHEEIRKDEDVEVRAREKIFVMNGSQLMR